VVQGELRDLLHDVFSPSIYELRGISAETVARVVAEQERDGTITEALWLLASAVVRRACERSRGIAGSSPHHLDGCTSDPSSGVC